MTPPLSPEAVAQMVADREAGTPGNFSVVQHRGDATDYIVTDHPDFQQKPHGNYVGETGLAAGHARQRFEADARRFARTPDLEAAVITLAAENARLREDTVQMLADADLDYNRKTNAMIAHHADQITSLRASEAAARERISELEAATQLSLDTADMSNSTRSALLGALNSGAALTPKTNGDTP